MITEYIVANATRTAIWGTLGVVTAVWPMFSAIRLKHGWLLGAVAVWLLPAAGRLLIASPFTPYRVHFRDRITVVPSWLYNGLLPALVYCFTLWLMRPFVTRTLAELTNQKWRAVRTLLPSLLPILVALAYTPLNEMRLVARFGCGCRDGFNTNTITLYVFACAFVISVGFSALLATRLTGWRSRVLCLLISVPLHGFVSIRMMSFNIWL